jgi:hypothetical protein
MEKVKYLYDIYFHKYKSQLTEITYAISSIMETMKLLTDIRILKLCVAFGSPISNKCTI